METVFVSGINRIRKIEAELLITQKQNHRNTYKIIFLKSFKNFSNIVNKLIRLLPPTHYFYP